MAQDRYAWTAAYSRLGALDSLARIGQRGLVGALREADPFDAHRVARGVHHDEHVFQAAIFLADELRERAAVLTESQHASRTRVNAELVLDRQTMHVVACTEGAVGIDKKLWHQKQGRSLHAVGCSGHARQHHMDDIAGEIVLAVSDEDLL